MHLLKLTRAIFERIFVFCLMTYLLLYLLELSFPGFVWFALNLNYFFYTSLLFGLVYVSYNFSSTSSEPKRYFIKHFSFKDYTYILVSGLAIFILAYNALSTIQQGRIIISLFVALSGMLIVIYLKNENSYIPEDEEIQRTVHFVDIGATVSLSIMFIFILYVNVVPSGTLSYTIKPSSNSRNVLEYTTGDDTLIGATASGDVYALATKNPSSISLRIPRRFQQIDAKVTYAPTKGDLPIRLGTININDGISYKDLVNYDPTLEGLPPYWQPIQDGDLVVWQKNPEYKKAYDDMEQRIQSIDDSYAEALRILDSDHQEGESDEEYQQKKVNLESRHNTEVQQVIASNQDLFDSYTPLYSNVSDFFSHIHEVYSQTIGYHFPLQDYFKIEDSNTPSTTYNQTSSMRGSYTFYIYQTEAKPISVSVTVRDANIHDGEDPIRLAIFENSEKIAEEFYPDDNNVLGNNKITDSRTFSIKTETLEPGMYKFLFESSYDVFTTHVTISSPYAAIQKILHVTDSKVYSQIIDNSYSLPVAVYTNSSSIQFSTAHDQSLQEIIINDEPIPISELRVWQQKNELPLVTKIVIPKGDVKLRGNGIFTFDQSSPLLNYREATYNGLDPNLLDNTNYIVANYQRPKEVNGWLVAESVVKVPDIGFNHNKAEFLLDFGNLSLDSKTVKIKSIDVTLTKEPLTFSRLFQKIKDVF